jgi:hydroxymethylpyrimidine pyrophosphatase-like HAD family hydrolase
MPQSQGLSPNSFKNIKLVATDMDGTLTHHGKFTPKLLQALADLAAVNIPVVIVTGRSAGWVSGLANYLPIAGAIAENGGLYFSGSMDEAEVLVPLIEGHRQALAEMFDYLHAEFPKLRPSVDNAYRLTDWTFDIAGISPLELQHMGDRCQEKGWGFTYSSIQAHIKLPQQDKAVGLMSTVQRHFPHISVDHIVTVGDSPNDESLFSPQFPCSVGVANVQHYLTQLTHCPIHITRQAESEGFWELAQLILKSFQ